MRNVVALCTLLVLACGGSTDGGVSNGAPPVQSPPPKPAAGTALSPVVLASDQSEPTTIAIDDENVYWVNKGGSRRGVYKVPKAGGIVTPLYEGLTVDVYSLAVDASSIYFPNGSQIIAVPVAGGASRVVTPAGGNRIAIAAGNVYWFEPRERGSLSSKPLARRVPVGGGAPATIELPTDLPLVDGIEWMASTGDAVYASIIPPGGIIRIPLDGRAANLLEVPEARGLAVDGDRIYYGARDSINAMATTGGSLTELARIRSPNRVGVDATFVYFAESLAAEGRLLKVSRNGGAMTVLAEHQNGPGTIAVDATSVYWNSVVDGTIKKVSK